MKAGVVILVWVMLIVGFVMFDDGWFADSPTHVIQVHPPAPTNPK